MKLPDRVGPLLDLLRAFCSSDATRGFSDNAREVFGPDAGDEPEAAAEFEDYLLFAHRDERGRSAVDLFLAAAPADLSGSVRNAIARFAHTEFGYFRVRSVRPGRWIEVGSVDRERSYRVVETQASRSVEVGSGLFARLVPYRGGYELGGAARAYPPDAAYGFERTIRSMPPEAREALRDPLRVYRSFRELSARPKPQPAENRLEAELIAERALRDCGIDLSVAEVQKTFRSLESPVEFLRELDPPPRPEDEAGLQRFLDAMMGLWNHTPRPELGEVTPHERDEDPRPAGHPRLPEHLAQDLLRTMAERIDPDDYADDDSRRAAMREVQDEWWETPQHELDGLTPRDVAFGTFVPALPPESELPPTDVPIHDPASLEPFLHAAAVRPSAAAWALGFAIAHEWTDAFDPAAVRFAIRAVLGPDAGPCAASTLLRDLLDAPLEKRTAWIGEVRAALDEREFEADVLCDALRFLAHTKPEDHAEVFCRYADHESFFVGLSALDGLAYSADESATELLAEIAIEATDSSQIEHALRGLWRRGELAVIQRILPRILARGDNSLAGLQCSLDVLGVTRRLRWRVEHALFVPDGVDDMTADERLADVAPPADPQVVRRAREVIPIEAGHELLRLVDAGRFRDAADCLLDAATGALKLVVDESDEGDENAVRDAAWSLLAVVDAIAASPVRRGGKRAVHRKILSTLGAILAWALRGRDLEAEWKAAEQAPERIVSLLESDFDTLDRRRLELAAEHVSLAELDDLLGSDRGSVLANALAVAALHDPDEFLCEAFDFASDYGSACEIAVAVGRRHGDRALSPLAEWAQEDEEEDAPEVLLEGLAAIATERAAAVARQTLDSAYFHGSDPVSPQLVFSHVLDLGHVGLIEDVLKRFEAGAFDLAMEASSPGDRAETIEDVKMCFEILGRDGDAERCVDAASAQWEASLDVLEDAPHGLTAPLPGVPLGSEDPIDPLGPFDPLDPYDELDSPGETIRRDEPKVGRNDPCPCGSGKKYKKCCGKS